MYLVNWISITPFVPFVASPLSFPSSADCVHLEVTNLARTPGEHLLLQSLRIASSVISRSTVGSVPAVFFYLFGVA